MMQFNTNQLQIVKLHYLLVYLRLITLCASQHCLLHNVHATLGNNYVLCT